VTQGADVLMVGVPNLLVPARASQDARGTGGRWRNHAFAMRFQLGTHFTVPGVCVIRTSLDSITESLVTRHWS